MKPPENYATWLDAAVGSFPNTNCDIGEVRFEVAERLPRHELAFLRVSNGALAVRVKDLEAAIKRALDDSESGKGWGPDVTVRAYLREALGK